MQIKHKTKNPKCKGEGDLSCTVRDGWFWSTKHGPKWSKLHQTMCFDTGLQINILYSGLVIILWPFLAFCGKKKAIFAIRGTKDSILEQKTWSKMEQTLPDYVFWYCPSDKYPLQWIGHNFMAIFGLLWSKKAIFATRGTKDSILEQKTWSKMEQTLPNYVFWYYPSHKNWLEWTGCNFMAIFSLLWSKKG